MTLVDPAGTVRIVLADDHTLFRAGIREMLLTVEGFDVVGEASTGDGAVLHAVRYSPDVLLLDVEMPGLAADEVIRQVRRRCPQTRIVVLTMHHDPAVMHQLLDCGAAAFLSKTSLRIELVAAVRAVAADAEAVLLAVPRASVRRPEPLAGTARRTPLTDRETDVLRLIAQAFSNGQIATRLHISEATVKRHLTNIYAKLGAVSRVDAIRKAQTARLIDPAEGAGP
ncbi:response regulator transcription factor [Plantactinospora sp. KBS50]|uniref:response regulator transcription factor n=1 Tax=Plantactinospora sp. KBS50 TaxID=2024580 RepID=UPI001E40FF4D|nr:response regulator transcription factor [Plantactinospora sp. KBS50]